MTDKLRAAAEFALAVLQSCLDNPDADDAIAALRTALVEQPTEQSANPVEAVFQEPYCYTYTENGEEYFAPPTAYVPDHAKPLYTAPQPAKQPLTDEECTRIYNEANGVTTKNPPITTDRIFKAMRAAHGITGGDK